jgi:hypothetical protein
MSTDTSAMETRVPPAMSLYLELLAHGCTLTQRGDKLVVRSPKGLMTAAMQASIRTWKRDLLCLLPRAIVTDPVQCPVSPGGHMYVTFDNGTAQCLGCLCWRPERWECDAWTWFMGGGETRYA